MTKNKALVMATLGLMTLCSAGNTLTNIAIVKKNGFTWNKETKRFEKKITLGYVDLNTNDQINRNNTFWAIGGFTAGIVTRLAIRKYYR